MSFGYSVSDVISLVQLAWRVVEGARKACGDYDDITKDVIMYHGILCHVQSEISKPEWALHQTDSRQSDLRALTARSRGHLRDLERVLDKYNALSERERSTKRLWLQVRFGNGEVQKVADIRQKISNCVSAISMTVQLLSLGSQGRVETRLRQQGGELQDISQSLSIILAKLTPDAPGSSIMTSYEDDDKHFWRSLRRELIHSGFSSSVLWEYRNLIKDYVKELGSRGVLDDRGPLEQAKSGELAEKLNNFLDSTAASVEEYVDSELQTASRDSSIHPPPGPPPVDQSQSPRLERGLEVPEPKPGTSEPPPNLSEHNSPGPRYRQPYVEDVDDEEDGFLRDGEQASLDDSLFVPAVNISVSPASPVYEEYEPNSPGIDGAVDEPETITLQPTSPSRSTTPNSVISIEMPTPTATSMVDDAASYQVSGCADLRWGFFIHPYILGSYYRSTLQIDPPENLCTQRLRTRFQVFLEASKDFASHGQANPVYSVRQLYHMDRSQDSMAREELFIRTKQTRQELETKISPTTSAGSAIEVEPWWADEKALEKEFYETVCPLPSSDFCATLRKYSANTSIRPSLVKDLEPLSNPNEENIGYFRAYGVYVNAWSFSYWLYDWILYAYGFDSPSARFARGFAGDLIDFAEVFDMLACELQGDYQRYQEIHNSRQSLHKRNLIELGNSLWANLQETIYSLESKVFQNHDPAYPQLLETSYAADFSTSPSLQPFSPLREHLSHWSQLVRQSLGLPTRRILNWSSPRPEFEKLRRKGQVENKPCGTSTDYNIVVERRNL